MDTACAVSKRICARPAHRSPYRIRQSQALNRFRGQPPPGLCSVENQFHLSFDFPSFLWDIMSGFTVAIMFARALLRAVRFYLLDRPCWGTAGNGTWRSQSPIPYSLLSAPSSPNFKICFPDPESRDHGEGPTAQGCVFTIIIQCALCAPTCA